MHAAPLSDTLPVTIGGARSAAASMDALELANLRPDGWPAPEPPAADPTERKRLELSQLSPAGLPEVLTSLAAQGELSADVRRRLLDAARCDAARFETLARE